MDTEAVREFIRESNAIENVTTEAAVESSMDAWEFLCEQPELTHYVVQEAHEYILEDLQPDIAGEYRDIAVHIGGDVAPPPQVVRPQMDTLLKWKPDSSLEAIEWHIAFEHIHPFADGNGRIGRLLYLWHCKELDITPIIWRADDRQGYYELFGSEIDIAAHID